MNTGKLSFVVHEHDATTLHFDFRLQIGSGMPSWAIPRGPTLDSNVKRLAVETTVHSLEYRNFEGVIKQINDLKEGEKVMEEGLKKGEIKFFLQGKKLKGSFALVKTKGFPPGVKNAWLLIKHKDEYIQVGYDAKDYDISAKTGKKLKEIS